MNTYSHTIVYTFREAEHLKLSYAQLRRVMDPPPLFFLKFRRRD